MEAKAALAQQAPKRGQTTAATGHPAAQNSRRIEPSTEQMDLDKGWNHVVRGGLVVKATITPPPNPNPSPQPVTEAPKQPKVTATKKTARPEKPDPKSTAAPKPATGKPKQKAATGVKNAANPQHPTW